MPEKKSGKMKSPDVYRDKKKTLDMIPRVVKPPKLYIKKKKEPPLSASVKK